MTTISWPANLPSDSPPTFETNNFSRQFGSNLIKTNMDKGPPKFRRYTTATPELLAGSITMSLDDYLNVFQDFYQDTIKFGALSFNFPEPNNYFYSTIATSSGSNTSTIYLTSAASSVDDYYNGMNIVVTNETDDETVVGTILDYVGSTRTITLSSPIGNTNPFLVGSKLYINTIEVQMNNETNGVAYTEGGFEMPRARTISFSLLKLPE